MTDDVEERGQAGVPGIYHPGASGRGFQNFSPEDAILPRVRLNGKTGVFEFNLGGETEATDQLTIVPLFMSKSRVLFDPEEDSSDVLCRSADDNAPTWIQPGFWRDDIPPRMCADCQYAKWNQDEEGKRQPPKCTVSWNFLAVRPDNPSTPFIFSVRGTSIPAASRMMTVLNRSGKDLFSAEITLGGVGAGEGIRRYFKMTFDSHRFLSDEEMAACEETYEAYVGDNFAMIASIMGGGRFTGKVEDEPVERNIEDPQDETEDHEGVPF